MVLMHTMAALPLSSHRLRPTSKRCPPSVGWLPLLVVRRATSSSTENRSAGDRINAVVVVVVAVFASLRVCAHEIRENYAISRDHRPDSNGRSPNEKPLVRPPVITPKPLRLACTHYTHWCSVVRCFFVIAENNRARLSSFGVRRRPTDPALRRCKPSPIYS